MKSTLLFCGLLLGLVPCIAQTSVHVSAGTNMYLPRESEAFVVNDFLPTISFAGGLSGRYDFTSKPLAVEFGVQFSPQTIRVHSSVPELGLDTTYDERLGWLPVSTRLIYKGQRDWNELVVGVQSSVKLYDQTNLWTQEGPNVAWALMVGYQFVLADRYRLGVHYQHGFTDILNRTHLVDESFDLRMSRLALMGQIRVY